MILISSIGRRVVDSFRTSGMVFAVMGSVLWLALDRRNWTACVKKVLVNQIYFSSVTALGLILFVSGLTGMALVYPVNIWIGSIGQGDLLGKVLVAVVVNQIAPLLVGFIILGRSGTAICAELAGMRSRGEIHVLEAQGVDPFVYLVMPRVLSLAVSSFLLSVVFITVSLFSGWVVGAVAQASYSRLSAFTSAIFMSFRIQDFAGFIIRAIAGGLIVGTICCVEGISTRGLSIEIPQAVTKGVVVSISALIVFSVVFSLITYF